MSDVDDPVIRPEAQPIDDVGRDPGCDDVEDREDHGLVNEDTPGLVDVEATALEEIIQNTWSRRARVDDYDSDDESDEEDDDENDLEGNTNLNASDADSDIEWEGKWNGLGMNDLVDEDLQRLIAEFSALFPFQFKVLLSH